MITPTAFHPRRRDHSAPPELLVEQVNACQSAVDIWDFGVLLLALTSGDATPPGRPLQWQLGSKDAACFGSFKAAFEAFYGCANGEITLPKSTSLMWEAAVAPRHVVANLAKQMRDLAVQCLKRRSSTRPTASKVRDEVASISDAVFGGATSALLEKEAVKSKNAATKAIESLQGRTLLQQTKVLAKATSALSDKLSSRTMAFLITRAEEAAVSASCAAVAVVADAASWLIDAKRKLIDRLEVAPLDEVLPEKDPPCPLKQGVLDHSHTDAFARSDFVGFASMIAAQASGRTCMVLSPVADMSCAMWIMAVRCAEMRLAAPPWAPTYDKEPDWWWPKDAEPKEQLQVSGSSLAVSGKPMHPLLTGPPAQAIHTTALHLKTRRASPLWLPVTGLGAVGATSTSR